MEMAANVSLQLLISKDPDFFVLQALLPTFVLLAGLRMASGAMSHGREALGAQVPAALLVACALQVLL
jgi:hypothetical protein